MTFLLTAAALCASGWALLALLGLETGRRPVDLATAWFSGTGWFALGSLLWRHGAGLPWGRAAALFLLGAPVAAWALRQALRRRSPPGAAGGATLESRRPEAGPAATAPRWWPRPAWLFGPMAALVLVVACAVLLHGADTPTHTDDGLRVRAYAAALAFRDDWPAAALGVLGMAGAVPTFVPALPAAFFGGWDPFLPAYPVLASFAALLALAISLASTRGAPERGWAGAFGLVTLPFFVYHATSTYADAVLAVYLAAGFLFHLEYGRGGDAADGMRAALLLVAAAMVKREGLLIAGTALAVLLGQAAWRSARGRPGQLRRVALAASPLLLVVAGMGLAVGFRQVVPFLDLFLARWSPLGGGAQVSGPAAASAPPPGSVLRVFRYALLESGNAGLVFWILPVAALVALPGLRTSGLGGPLLTVAALFAEATVGALWLVPEFTLNQTTVHRSLLATSVLGVLLSAAILVDGPQGPPVPLARAATGASRAVAPPARGRRRR